MYQETTDSAATSCPPPPPVPNPNLATLLWSTCCSSYASEAAVGGRHVHCQFSGQVLSSLDKNEGPSIHDCQRALKSGLVLTMTVDPQLAELVVEFEAVV